MIKKLLFIICFIASLPIIVLAFNNAEQVTVSYFFGEVTTYLSWLIIGAFVLGVLVMLPFFAMTGLIWKVKAKGLEKQLAELVKQRKREAIAQSFNDKNSTNT